MSAADVDFDDPTEVEFQARLDECCSPPSLEGMGAVLAAASDRQAFVISGSIPARSVTLILGAPDQGKSWLAYSLGLSVARNDSWLGAGNDLGECAPVLIFNFDNPRPELGRRFKIMGAIEDDPILCHSTDGLPTGKALLLHPNPAVSSGELLRRMVMRTKAQLVVIDSLREAHTGDENASQDMAPIMRQIRALTQPTGAAVIVVHHTVKNADVSDLYKARGSSAIVAAADAAIMADEGVAIWCKTRGWKMPEDEKRQPFEVVDLDKGPTVVRPRDVPKQKGKKK